MTLEHQFEESETQGFLPEEFYDLISNFSDKIKMKPQEKRNNHLPKSTRIRVSRLKAEARKTDKPELEVKAERIAETERLSKFGYTEREIVARGRLNYEIEHLANLGESQREDQVLAGMKIAWYAFAAGLVDREKVNEIIDEIDEINPIQMKKIEDEETWTKIYKEEIKLVLPLVR